MLSYSVICLALLLSISMPGSLIAGAVDAKSLNELACTSDVVLIGKITEYHMITHEESLRDYPTNDVRGMFSVSVMVSAVLNEESELKSGDKFIFCLEAVPEHLWTERTWYFCLKPMVGEDQYLLFLKKQKGTYQPVLWATAFSVIQLSPTNSVLGEIKKRAVDSQETLSGSSPDGRAAPADALLQAWIDSAKLLDRLIKDGGYLKEEVLADIRRYVRDARKKGGLVSGSTRVEGEVPGK